MKPRKAMKYWKPSKKLPVKRRLPPPMPAAFADALRRANLWPPDATAQIAAYAAALREAVGFIDLLQKGADHGWTTADVKKLQAIRALAVLP